MRKLWFRYRFFSSGMYVFKDDPITFDAPLCSDMLTSMHFSSQNIQSFKI